MTTLKIQQVAKSKGYSIGKLSRESQLDIRLVRRYWHNQVRSISIDAIDAIAEVLQVSFLDLWDLTGGGVSDPVPEDQEE